MSNLLHARGGKRVAPGSVFLHGVGSFDPLADSVILWTRATLEAEGGQRMAAAQVGWEVSERKDFCSIVQRCVCMGR